VIAQEVELRALDEREWELWRDLRHRVLATDPDAFGSTLAREQAFTEADWRLRVRGGRSFVAFVDDRPVGMGALLAEESGGWSVVAMWVDPEARGLGIGRRVLDHLVATVPAGAVVGLWVTDGNPARHLYESAGFVGTGEVAPLRPGSVLTKSRMVRPARR
jgi:ribosomal protein S18 acetylase RimI-like enzyme